MCQVKQSLVGNYQNSMSLGTNNVFFVCFISFLLYPLIRHWQHGSKCQHNSKIVSHSIQKLKLEILDFNTYGFSWAWDFTAKSFSYCRAIKGQYAQEMSSLGVHNMLLHWWIHMEIFKAMPINNITFQNSWFYNTSIFFRTLMFKCLMKNSKISMFLNMSVASSKSFGQL